MTDSLFRVYLDPAEIDEDSGYPWQWKFGVRTFDLGGPIHTDVRIPDVVREQAGHRCVRCLHPFVVGETPGRWSPCDQRCVHGGPVALIEESMLVHQVPLTRSTETLVGARRAAAQATVEDLLVVAEWRVLTVHHLNGIKADCRWWNLAALCQRCHLTIQAKVHMHRPYHREHSDWFKPYVAGFYAWEYAGLDLTREETEARLEELLALEHRQLELG